MSDDGSITGRGAVTPDIDVMSGAYVLDALTDEERTEFETRMSESAEIRQEVTELNDTVLLLAHAVEPVTPSASLRSSLMGLLDSTPQLAPLEERTAPEAWVADETARVSRMARHADHEAEILEPIPLARQRWFMRPGALLIGAAAAAVLVFGGVNVANSFHPAPSTSQQADGASQIFAASDVQHTASPVSTGGTATVYWSDSLERSAVILSGVTSLPTDKTYQLWYIKDGKAASAGLVDANSNTVTAELQGDLQKGDTVGITVEPSGGSKAPTTKPIAAVPITA